MQYSTDNGLSWHNVTGWDSAISECFSQRTTPTLDALTDEQCCGVAKYFISWFDELFNDWLDSLDAHAGVGAAVAAILGIFTPFQILIPILSEIALTAVERGTNAIRASYTSQVREELESLLYCMIRANNNRFTYVVLDQWRQSITGTLGLNRDTGDSFNFARRMLADTMLAFTQEEIYRRAYIGSLDSSAACAAQYTCQNNLDLLIDPPRAFTSRLQPHM